MQINAAIQLTYLKTLYINSIPVLSFLVYVVEMTDAPLDKIPKTYNTEFANCLNFGTQDRHVSITLTLQFNLLN